MVDTSILSSLSVPALVQSSIFNINKILTDANIDPSTAAHLAEVPDTFAFVNLVKTFAGEEGLVKITMLLYAIDERPRGMEYLHKVLYGDRSHPEIEKFLHKFIPYLAELKKVEKQFENYENN